MNRSNNTMTNVAEIQRIKEKYPSLASNNIFVDDIGIGRGVTDRLKEVNIPATGVIAGGEAQDKTKFMNTKAEGYWLAAKWIKEGGSVLRVKPHTKQFAYTGLIRCGECGGTITAEEKTQIICSNCKYKFAATVKSRTHCPKCNTAIAEMKNPKILEYCYYHCQ